MFFVRLVRLLRFMKILKRSSVTNQGIQISEMMGLDDGNIYPEYLIPKSHYKIISYRPEHTDCYLIRVTPNKNYRDLTTNDILEDCIASPTAHVLDYSLLILGQYSEKDFKFSVKDDKVDPKGYNRNWEMGTDGIMPLSSDVDIDGNKGGIYFKFISLMNIRPQYIYSGTIQKSLIPKIIHKPTNCNFWHFEVRWLNATGEDIFALQGPWKKRAATGIKTNLRQICSEILPTNYFELEDLDYVLVN